VTPNRAVPVPASSARRRLERRASTVGALVFLLGVCAAGGLRSQCPDGTPPPCGARPARVVAAPAANTVAVMYLDNATRDTSDAYLADGLTEEITTKLGQIGRLAVTSNTTMRRYRSTAAAADPAELGRALRVTQLVSGSVRRAGHRIRVNIELVRARDGVQLWADAYDRTDADLLSIEEDVARAVAGAIAGRLLPGEQMTLAVRPTRNPQAYDHFLRGNFVVARRTPAAAREAVTEYQDAIALDPGFARAYGRLSLAYGLFADWGWPFPGLSYDSLLALASGAADHAVALDSTSADAWLARGFASAYLHPASLADAFPAFRRAIALDPNNAEAHHQYGLVLMNWGRDSEAVEEFRRALAIEPGRVVTLENLMYLRYCERRFDEARRLIDSALAIDPQSSYLYADRANLSLTLGDVPAARADADIAVRLRPSDYVIPSEALVAMLEAVARDTTGARARLDRLVQSLSDPAHPSYTLAQWLALAAVHIGDRDRALALLESAWPPGACVWFIMRDPGFDPIRDTPRFRALVERLRPR